MAAKPNRSGQRRATGLVANSQNSDRIPLVSLLAWSPLLARWLTPTEGTSLGDTLWLTAFTFLVAIIVAWHRSRNTSTFRFDRLDLAVIAFAGAHVISAFAVVVTEGHQRAATNMLWEWTAIAVQFALIRSTLTGPLRDTFLRVFVAVWIAQAGLGIWQHFVWYPASVESYEQLRGQLDELQSGASGLSGVERQMRLRKVQTAFMEQGIPMSGPGRQQFEGRLRDSADPVGFFALTNTFAGFLAMLTVILYAAILVARRSLRGAAAAAIPLGIVCWCLLLTKSRTAMCGAVAGVIVVTIARQLSSRSGAQLQRLVRVAVIVPLAAGLILSLAVVSGGIDSDVLSDATKSLQYRFEYWSATSRVIADHPGLGTGPGNFRDAYLIHKLPQSSEEIADPHNFILDVTANSGVLGLASLGFLMWIVVASAFRAIRTAQATTDSAAPNRMPASVAPLAIALAGLIVVGWGWLIDARPDLRVCCVCGVAAVIAWILESRRSLDQTDSVGGVAIAGSLTALLVHLLGAGGIAMPAVTGVLLAFTAILANGTRSAASEPLPALGSAVRRVNVEKTLVAFATLALIGCVWSAFLPVLKCTTSLQEGDYAIAAQGNAAAARRAYDAASKDDWLSPEPLRRASALAFQQWQVTGERRYFDDSIASTTKALERSPHTASIMRELGYRYLQYGKTAETGHGIPSDEWHRLAIESYERALDRYPTHSLWISEYAEVLSLAGDSPKAAEAARRALQLDDLNQTLHHYDRQLPSDVRQTVERLAARS